MNKYKILKRDMQYKLRGIRPGNRANHVLGHISDLERAQMRPEDKLSAIYAAVHAYETMGKD